VVSEPEEILCGEVEPTKLSGVGTENYKINVKKTSKAVEENQVTLSFSVTDVLDQF
jgi:hypothetical protein